MRCASGASRARPDVPRAGATAVRNWNVFLLCRTRLLAYGGSEPAAGRLADHVREVRSWRTVSSLTVRGPRAPPPSATAAGGSSTPPSPSPSKGGFDAVQMRAVAEQADVALGTLYRYFPSKIHLLVSALGRAVRGGRGRARPQADPRRHRRRPGRCYVLSRTTRGLQREPAPHRGADPRVHVRRRLGGRRDPRRRPAAHHDAHRPRCATRRDVEGPSPPTRRSRSPR